MPLSALPIDRKIEEILASLETSNTLLVQASAGSGKTTRIPPALLKATWASDREIWVLVPRRLAAKMAAMRVAEECGEAIGETIGYQFRFEKVSGPKTRLRFLTEGMLLRLLLQDPHLSRVACVILDEFHERHIHTDVALAYLRRLQSTVRKDLRLIIMSATLPTDLLQDYLPSSSEVCLEIPLHPVTIHYLAQPPRQRLEDLICDCVAKSLQRVRGDILIFLPGMADIRRAEERLLSSFRQEIHVLPLHGELPREQQYKIFEKFPKPKVILSTNVAESSITIEGITTVIDSGLHRQASYSWWSGIPRLTTRSISQASAIQRAGRAGRTGPGFCERLFTQSDFKGRPQFETPEILRADLSQTLLEIKCLIGSSWQEFKWLQPPHPESLSAAVELLYRLGALDRANTEASVTEVGRRMAGYPLHPRLARMVIEGETLGILKDATTLAALISEDELEEIDLFHVLESQRLSQEAQRLQKSLIGSQVISKKGDREALRLAILAGFPDRVAQRRTGKRQGQVELRLMNAGSVAVSEQAISANDDYFVVVDAQEKKRQGQKDVIREANALISLSPEILLQDHAHFLQESTDLLWNENLKKVEEVESLRYGGLVLSETRKEPKQAEQAVQVLFRDALRLDPKAGIDANQFLKSLERFIDPSSVEGLLGRIQIFENTKRDGSPSLLEGDAFLYWIQDAFLTHTQFSGVSAEDIVDWMKAALPSAMVHDLNRLLPPSVTLIRGRRTPIHYRLGQTPWIESRLQDFFGMTQGPFIMNGTVPLKLHLLAPNHRPIQVTQDLASFWKNTYPEVRRQLSRRYPKHSWPEDPR